MDTTSEEAVSPTSAGAASAAATQGPGTPPGSDKFTRIADAVIDSISFAKEEHDGKALSDEERTKARETARKVMGL